MTDPLDTADVSLQCQDGEVTIGCCGCVDLTNCQEFGQKLTKAAETEDEVTADLRRAEFVDSAVLAIISGAGKLMRQRGKRLKVRVCDGTHPHRVLQILNLAVLVDVIVERNQDDAAD